MKEKPNESAKQDWVLSIGGTNEDGVTLEIYKNKTTDEMKKIIVQKKYFLF